MKEIRFRGKRTDGGAWVVGDVMQYLSGDCAIMPKNGWRGHGFEAADCHKRFQVDPATVGQFTSLRDRDGKDIYEGDMTKKHNMTKMIAIDIPDGKKAEWVDGVLTLVDACPEKEVDCTTAETPDFKFRVGDKVYLNIYPASAVYTIIERFVSDGRKIYTMADDYHCMYEEYKLSSAPWTRFNVGDKVTVDGCDGKVTKISVCLVIGENSISYRLDDGETVAESRLSLYDEGVAGKIRTFDDARAWCEGNNKGGLVAQYYDALNVGLQRCPDVIAYFRLRIIACALNKGWQPTEGERRFYPYFAECGLCVKSATTVLDYPVALSFRFQAHAKYAGLQFADLYRDFYCADQSKKR